MCRQNERRRSVFVPVVAVTGVQVAIVEVIDMITMGDRRVSAVRSVHMGMITVLDT